MSHPRQSDCIFCKIIGREVPAAIIYEDDEVIAFMDAFPSAEGHALVVPKGHYPDVLNMPVAAVQAVAAVAQRVAKAQRRALEPDGMVLSQFNGAAAGQTVFHYHVHITPRWQGQPRKVHGNAAVPLEQLETVAARLRAALE